MEAKSIPNQYLRLPLGLSPLAVKALGRFAAQRDPQQSRESARILTLVAMCRQSFSCCVQKSEFPDSAVP